MLADTLRHEHACWRPLPVASPALAELRALTRDRDRLLATQQRTEAQLRAILEAYHPAAARLFSSIDRQITLAFIADYPTPQAAAVVGEQRMARFLARSRYTGRVKPAVLVGRVATRQPADGCAGHRGQQGALRAGLRRAAGAAQPATGRLRRGDRAGRWAPPDAPIFASFPGVGPIGTAVLLAEAGLALVTRASGRSCRVRFRYAANRNFREACTWWAYNLLKESPWASDVYRQARARGQHP